MWTTTATIQTKVTITYETCIETFNLPTVVTRERVDSSVWGNTDQKLLHAWDKMQNLKFIWKRHPAAASGERHPAAAFEFWSIWGGKNGGLSKQGVIWVPNLKGPCGQGDRYTLLPYVWWVRGRHTDSEKKHLSNIQVQGQGGKLRNKRWPGQDLLDLSRWKIQYRKVALRALYR